MNRILLFRYWKHQRHSFSVELHIHWQKQTKDNSINLLQRCFLLNYNNLFKIDDNLMMFIKESSDCSQSHITRCIVRVAINACRNTGKSLQKEDSSFPCLMSHPCPINEERSNSNCHFCTCDEIILKDTKCKIGLSGHTVS